MKTPLFLTASLLVSTAQADTPQQVLEGLVAQAGSASTMRGEHLFRGKFSGGKSAASCTECHGGDARTAGQHIKTHKRIEPMAPVVNRERFTDPAKVQKWFRRNCPEVLGRACTPQEMADFTAYMVSIK